MVDVGVTLGVEEEYHLVRAQDGGLADAPEVVAEARERLGDLAQEEISTSQLEVATPVCSSLQEVREQLRALRRGAADAAAVHGCEVLPAATHPTARWSEQRLTDGERYQHLARRWGLLALQQTIAGCHVHVSVPDPELAVHVLDRLRPDLPVLLALSGSSPFWEGTDTLHASYRTPWFSRWPVTGVPEVFGSRAAYDATVASLVAAGVADDASHLYWDARPATRYPTVEVRVADTMPLLDDVVLHAALCRALVLAAAEAALAGEPVPELRPELARAARWRAARHGLEGTLLVTTGPGPAGAQRPAAEVVRALVDRLRPQLEQSGDDEEVRALTEATLARGTSSTRQRAVARAAGDLDAVVRSVVAELHA